jgi:membrane-associated protease RseP (regulator of RpoE activity)
MPINAFLLLDLFLLAVILISLTVFLRKNRERLSKDGILYLYKTKWGIKLIEKTGNKYKKTLKAASYISILTGYLLMMGILYLLGVSVFQYLSRPEIVETIRAPPIIPLLPYSPQIFGLGDFFPPLYTIYFIAAILIVATVHEFSHGIFAQRWGVRVKSTGFAFLRFFPAIFGAFVEPDEGQMKKKGKFHEMSVLSAGVFSNVVVGIIFFVFLIAFFHLAFSPAGVAFSNYPYASVNLSSISSVNGISIENPGYGDVLPLANDSGLNKIVAGNVSYVIAKESLERQSLSAGSGVALYYDAPAINARLERVILKIDGDNIDSVEDLRSAISSRSPGEIITLTVLDESGEVYDKDVFLGESPFNKSSAWLGIGFSPDNAGFFKKELLHFTASFRPENLNFVGNTYYGPLLGDFSGFFYYLIWWIVLISFLVALFNMLPVSILDGGRFFYLTLLAITKSDRVAKFVYGIFGYTILFAFLLLMLRYVFSFF